MIGYFFTITSTDTSAIVSNAGNLISDMLPLIVIVIGIEIALIIYEAVMSRKR
jgi:hypothetical protein